MYKMAPVTVMLALCALAGCGETTSVPTTMSPTAADMAAPAYSACVAAIAKTTGKTVADIAVFDYLSSEAGAQMQASVAGAEAPWRCLSSNSGVVAEVVYTGSEGAL